MNDERRTGALDPLRRTRYVLAGICCIVYVGVLLAFARMVREEPLRPLHHVGVTAACVLAIFALCLASVAIFTAKRADAERQQRDVQR